MARLGCSVIAPAEGLLSVCAPSAFLFQGDVTGLLWKKLCAVTVPTYMACVIVFGC